MITRARSTVNCLLICVMFSSLYASERIAVFPDVLNPTQILVNRDHIYIVEAPRISIYSRSSLKPVKQFGRAGEGPGEFKIQANTNPQQFHVDLRGQRMLVSQVGKISLFTAMGDPLEEMPLSEGNRYRMAGNGFLGFGVAVEGKVRMSTLNLYDSGLRKTAELYRKKSWIQEGEGWNILRGSYPHVAVLEGRIFSIGLDMDFRIEVYDLRGKKIQTITRDYRPVKFTEQDTGAVLEGFRTNPATAPEFHEWKRLLRFPEVFPAIRNIFSDGSRLLVRTFRADGDESEFFVYMPDGTFVKKLMLPIRASAERWSNPFLWDSAPFTFYDGDLYQLAADEENETYQLQRIRLPISE